MKKRRMMMFMAAMFAVVCLWAGCGKSGEEEKEEGAATDQFAEPSEGDTYARINIKDFGTISVRFFEKEAPLAVENFVTHAREGYYDGVSFHRVIKDFMIQGGDPDGTGRGGESIWGKGFEDEFSDGLHPFRGALCMANTGQPGTNGSQFFIVHAGEDSIRQLEELLSEEYGWPLRNIWKRHMTPSSRTGRWRHTGNMAEHLGCTGTIRYLVRSWKGMMCWMRLRAWRSTRRIGR